MKSITEMCEEVSNNGNNPYFNKGGVCYCGLTKQVEEQFKLKGKCPYRTTKEVKDNLYGCLKYQ